MSPPWFGRRTCKNGSAKSRETAAGALADAFANALPNGQRGLTPPLLLACVRSPTELRLLRCTNAHAPGAAGVSPPSLRLPQSQCGSAMQRRQSPAYGASSLRAHYREPRGAYAPPLLAVHAFVHRESRFFTVERTPCTRAAGVSRPCVALTHLRRRLRKCSAHCRPPCWRTPLQSRCCKHGSLRPPLLFACRSPSNESRIVFPSAVSRTTAGLRQPLLVHVRWCIAEVAIVGATPVVQAAGSEGVGEPGLGRIASAIGAAFYG